MKRVTSNDTIKEIKKELKPFVKVEHNIKKQISTVYGKMK